MSIVNNWLLENQTCCCPTVPTSAPTVAPSNPMMYYDSTLGTPTAQNIIPTYPALAAMIYALNGTDLTYTWNPITGLWK